MAVKGPAMASVAARIAPLLGSETMVLTAMNGVPWWFFHGFGGRFAGTRLDAIDRTAPSPPPFPIAMSSAASSICRARPRSPG